MALALRELCYSIVDGGTDNKGTAAATIASQIGWIADRCIGFDHHDSDFWMLPPIWKCDESEVTA